MQRNLSITLFATLFSGVILALGYFSFGLWVMLIFSSGFLTGLLLWMLFPTSAAWPTIKVPYWLTFIFFIAHRIEEKFMGFFNMLSEITGTPTPEIGSFKVISLVLLSVVGWLFVPFLIKRGYQFGYYLAWTFFAAMGITELAHLFVFPFLTDKQYGYFPGMASVIVLAPLAWWGIYCLLKKSSAIETNTKGYGV